MPFTSPSNQSQEMKINIINLKKGAKVTLTILLLDVVRHLVAVYQTRSQLVSPLISETTIWQINKQFIFHAIVSATASIIGLLLYFFDKYLFVIILIALILIANQFLYI
jgi:VIT1/CCC1 family predicted Fe2+/Mn2+ transporter